MMVSVKSYLLSILCAAMACAIVSSMSEKKGTQGTLMKLTTGVFLAFTVISPISTIQLEELSILTEQFQAEASTAAAFGQSVAEESKAAFIKSQSEAYILDKAATLNTQLSVDVTLGRDLRPESVSVYGTVSPYVKFRLASIVEEELGIAKENQQWIE